MLGTYSVHTLCFGLAVSGVRLRANWAHPCRLLEAVWTGTDGCLLVEHSVHDTTSHTIGFGKEGGHVVAGHGGWYKWTWRNPMWSTSHTLGIWIWWSLSFSRVFYYSYADSIDVYLEEEEVRYLLPLKEYIAYCDSLRYCKSNYEIIWWNYFSDGTYHMQINWFCFVSELWCGGRRFCRNT